MRVGVRGPYALPHVVPQIYEAGMALFNDGQLRASYDKFEAVLALVPVKTKVRQHGAVDGVSFSGAASRPNDLSACPT